MSEEAPSKKGLAAIKGTHDILPSEVGLWQQAETLARATFELYGYREIRTPIFEATELFEHSSGQTSDVVTKEMYTFTDKGGRSVTLRPEYTPSVVRAIIEHRLDLKPEPLRFYYFGPMFRYDKPQKGRYRQFHQVDVEVFGELDAAADAELIEMAQAFLAQLGITETETLVNSVGCRACRPAYGRALRQVAAAKKDALCEDCRRKADLNPLRIFDCKIESCRRVADAFPRILDHLCAECREHFAQLRSYLDLYGIPYRVEPKLVRGLDYYTKTTFEIISGKLGAQNSLVGGGRYDDMMKDFGGHDLAATGFAMGLERLLSVARLEPPRPRFLYIVTLGEDGKRAGMTLARSFRRAGVECLIEFKDRGLKAQLGRASKLGAAWALIAGEDEVRAGRFELKDLSTGRQVAGTPDELLASLRHK